MNPRERALAALNHQIPDQIPPTLRGMVEAEAYTRSLGIEGARGFDVDPLKKHWGIGVKGFWPDWRGPNPLAIWGTPSAPTYTCTLERPLAKAETVAEVEAHAWPDPNHFDFAPMREMLQADTTFVRVGPTWDPIFARILELFGMERALENLYLNPAVFEAALAHIDDFYTTYYRNEIESCGDLLDFFGLGDDFADQRQLLIPPEYWRRYLKPLYAKYIGMARSAGLRAWMHMCGAIGEVLPDLIEIGLEVWENVQAHLPGSEPERLKREFGRHMVFVGGIDCQHVLSCGTPVEVRRHVGEMIRALGRGGGFLCGPYHGVTAGVPFENITAMYETIGDFRGDGCTL